jgi:hypothetical protein
MAILVILPFLILFLAWSRQLRSAPEAFLTAAAAWGAILMVITEVLSRFDWITRNGLIAAWIIASIAAFALVRCAPRRGSSPSNEKLDWLSRSIIWFLAIVSLLLGIVALIGPPNSFDAMTYHLPRVIHWIQDRNVEFYPVQSYDPVLNPLEYYGAQQVRQLTMAPGAEYIILNLQAITGGERWSAMPQWFAYVGCLIGVWTLTGTFGGGRRACALASLFAGTLPMACLQAVSTQNDLVCAFWTICFVWLIWRGNSWFHVFLCGISLGLALLTKATAYIYAAPFALGWLAFLLVRRPRRPAARLAIVGGLAVLLNLPTYCRNYQFNQTLLGNSDHDLPYSNAAITAGGTVSNLIRNTALEIAFPPGAAGRAVESGSRQLDRLLGQNPDDQDTTFPFTRFDLSNVNYLEEDSTPSPLHVVLIIVAAFGIRPIGRPAMLHLAAIAIAYVLLCAYLRWQPWHARLHMALFMLASPCVGMVMARWKDFLAAGAVALLGTSALILITFNARHPLTGPQTIFNTDRDSRRFIERPLLLASFRQVADAAKGCRQVGLIFSDDEWEYPLDIMLKEQDPEVRIETYPLPHIIRPATRNRGWNPALTPDLIVRFYNGVPFVYRR